MLVIHYLKTIEAVVHKWTQSTRDYNTRLKRSFYAGSKQKFTMLQRGT